MIKNPSIAEFEAAVTMRVLLDRCIDRRSNSPRDTFSGAELLSQSIFAANDIFKEIAINRELWVRTRGKKAFVFHEPTNRIAAEMVIVSDDAGRGTVRRPRAILLGKKGYLRTPTIGDLVVDTARLGASGFNRRRKRINHNLNERRKYYGKNHQNQTK
jgi:hypothetical protein